jgi:hypothetical protein
MDTPLISRSVLTEGSESLSSMKRRRAGRPLTSPHPTASNKRPTRQSDSQRETGERTAQSVGEIKVGVIKLLLTTSFLRSKGGGRGGGSVTSCPRPALHHLTIHTCSVSHILFSFAFLWLLTFQTLTLQRSSQGN